MPPEIHPYRPSWYTRNIYEMMHRKLFNIDSIQNDAELITMMLSMIK